MSEVNKIRWGVKEAQEALAAAREEGRREGPGKERLWQAWWAGAMAVRAETPHDRVAFEEWHRALEVE